MTKDKEIYTVVDAVSKGLLGLYEAVGEINRIMEQQPEVSDEEKAFLKSYKGYKRKYIIRKASGEQVDPNADYFVLRLDKDPHALNALAKYAESVRKENELFADDLAEILQGYNYESHHPPSTPHVPLKISEEGSTDVCGDYMT